MTTQDLKDTVDRETRQTDNTNMLGGTNLMIDPKYSDFIGIKMIMIIITETSSHVSFSCKHPGGRA